MQRKPLRKLPPKSSQLSRLTPCCMSEIPKTIKKNNKQNADKIFFVQNQCQVLKLKGKDIEISLNGLRIQLVELEQRKKSLEKECLAIEKEIQLLENGNVPELQTNILKLQVVLNNKSNEIREWETKIMKLKQTIQSQTFNIQELNQKNNNIQMQRFKIHSEDGGVRTLQKKLEEEIQSLKSQKRELLEKNIEYQPHQQKMNQHIQKTIKVIGDQKIKIKQKVSEYSITVLVKIFERIKSSQTKLALQNYFINAHVAHLTKKKLHGILLISQSFVNKIKQSYFQKFKRLINQRQQQIRLIKALEILSQIKIKHRIMSTWKKEFLKHQFAALRKQEVITGIVKIMQAIQASLVCSTFNFIKEWNNKIAKGGSKLREITKRFQSKKYRKGFFEIWNFAQQVGVEQRQEGFQLQDYAYKVQYKYFKAWCHYIKSSRVTKLGMKFKFFNILQQNKKQARRNILLQGIHLIVKKNNLNKLLMKCFWALKTSIKSEIIQENIIRGELMEKEIQNSNTLTAIEMQRKVTKCRSIGSYRLQYLYKKAMRLGLDKIQERSNLVDRVTSIQQTLKRTIKISKLSMGFRQLILNCTLSSQCHVKSQIDHCVSDIRRRADSIRCIKQDAKILCSEYQINKIQCILQLIHCKYLKTTRVGLRSIERCSVKNTNASICLSKLLSITSRLLKRLVFLDIQQFYMSSKKKQLHEIGISNLFKKKSILIKQKFIQELQDQQSRNRKFRNRVQQTFESQKIFNLSSSFQSLKENVKRIQVLSTKRLELQLQNDLNIINTQIKQKTEAVKEMSSDLKSQMASIKSYKLRCSINKLAKLKYKPATLALERWSSLIKRQNNIKQCLHKFCAKLKILQMRMGYFQLIMIASRFRREDQITKCRLANQQYQENTKRANEYSQNLQICIQELKTSSSQYSSQSSKLQTILSKFQQMKIDQFQSKQLENTMKLVFVSWREQSRKVKNYLSRMLLILGTDRYILPFKLLVQNSNFQSRMHCAKLAIRRHMDSCDRSSLKQFICLWRSETHNMKIQLLKQQISAKQNSCREVDVGIGSSEVKYQSSIKNYFRTKFIRRFIENLSQIYKKQKLQKQLIRLTQKTYKRITFRNAILKVRQYYEKTKQQKTNSLDRNLKTQKNKLKKSFDHWKSRHDKLQKFKKIFLQKYLDYNLSAYYSDFLRNFKQLSQLRTMQRLNKTNSIIYKLVTFYQNSLVSSLQKGFSKWRNNSQTLMTRKKLLKRLFKKATSTRVQLMFSIWRVEARARSIYLYHQQEGEIKLKKNQYNRTRRYIEQFKEQKGLVVYDGSTLVSSPRYQRRQKEQDSNHMNRKYKLLSSLILMESNQLHKVQLWNSLKYYLKINQKIRLKALFVHNSLRNKPIFWAFRTWKKASTSFSERLSVIDKRDLVHQIKCIQGKIDILNSSKYQLQKQMISEISRTQRTHKFLQSKAVFSKILVVRVGQRLQRQALNKWRTITKSIVEYQQETVELMALRRIQQLCEEISSLQQQIKDSLLVNQKLKLTAMEGVEIAESVKHLSVERDELNNQIQEQSLTCQALSQQNVFLQQRFNLAHKEAFQLLNLARN